MGTRRSCSTPSRYSCGGGREGGRRAGRAGGKGGQGACVLCHAGAVLLSTAVLMPGTRPCYCQTHGHLLMSMRGRCAAYRHGCLLGPSSWHAGIQASRQAPVSSASVTQLLTAHLRARPARVELGHAHARLVRQARRQALHLRAATTARMPAAIRMPTAIRKPTAIRLAWHGMAWPRRARVCTSVPI